jgi:MYXO-CTERM domain-containing protein
MVIMIGNGVNRGAATDSDDPAIWTTFPDPPYVPPIPGWYWGGSRVMRWGENVVEGPWPDDPLDTVSFFTTFDYPTAPDHQDHEAQAGNGDSGGAVFAEQGNSWELAGIMFAIATWPGHLTGSALRDEQTGAADLSHYRDQILALTAEPVPEPAGSTGLGAGLVLLALLGRRRRQPSSR